MAVYGNASGIIRGVVTTEPIHIDGEDGVGIVRIYIEDGRFKYELTDGTIGDAGAATGVEIDDTLSVEGAAADAKATGDYFLANDEVILGNSNAIDAIESKIPSEASSTNELADKAYVDGAVNIHGLTTENDIADADELAFYDTSASTRRKTAWSNIKAKLKSYFDTLYLGASALSGYATQAWVNAQGFITSLAGYATQAWVQSQGYGTYTKPSGGIPKTDLTSAVQTSLGLADSAVQPEAGKGLFSGNYNDLTNKPTIPTVNDAVLTIKQGGAVKGTFSANASSATEINLDAGGGADNTFVVNGSYDGTQWGSFDKTFAEIDSAFSAGKIVELHMRTDEQISYYTLPMVGNNDALITFAGYDAVDYDEDHNMIIVTVDDSDEWNISHPDYAKKDDLPEFTTDPEENIYKINDQYIVATYDMELNEITTTYAKKDELPEIEIDSTVTSGSNNLVTSGAVFSFIAALDGNGVAY